MRVDVVREIVLAFSLDLRPRRERFRCVVIQWHTSWPRRASPVVCRSSTKRGCRLPNVRTCMVKHRGLASENVAVGLAFEVRARV